MSVYSQVPSLKEALARQIADVKEVLRDELFVELMGCILFGSAARGEATYRSDIDLLMIIDVRPLTYSVVQRSRDLWEKTFSEHGRADLLQQPLHVEFTVVTKEVFATSEPGMRQALTEGKIIFDRDGIVRKSLADVAPRETPN